MTEKFGLVNEIFIEDENFKALLEKNKITYLRRKSNSNLDEWMKMAIVDKEEGIFHIYPKKSVINSNEDRYDQVKEIYFDIEDSDFVKLSDQPFEEESTYSYSIPKEIFPKGIGRYFAYGLGFPKKYSTFLNAIESQTHCNKIYISCEPDISISGDIFTVNRDIYENHIKDLDHQNNMVADVARRFKEISSTNLVKDATGEQKTPGPTFRSAPRIAASRAFSKEISEEEFDEVVNLFVQSFPSQSRTLSKKIIALQEELMVNSLTSVITEAERLMSQKLNERDWQKFFIDYQIILQQTFYAPIEIIQKEAHLRQQHYDGSGGVITDFLTKNKTSRNLLLIEVKNPSTTLIANKPYRGRGDSEVYPVHRNLAGAISQLQSQIYAAQSHFPYHGGVNDPKHNMRLEGPIKGALIIGKISDYNDLQRDSFNRFRSDLHSLEIITYDELIDRLKTLQNSLLNLSNSSVRE